MQSKKLLSLPRLQQISGHLGQFPKIPSASALSTAATSAAAAPTPSDRAFYKYWLDIQTRWMDNDQYQHVNNAVYYLYFDTVVNEYLIRFCGLKPAEPPKEDGAIGLVVSSNCTYKAPLEFPDVIQAGLSIVKLGSSSVTYQIGIFSRDKNLFAATGSFVHVFVDPVSRRPKPIPKELRAGMEKIVVA